MQLGGIFAGGYRTWTQFDTIEYFTIASTGNTSSFGNLTLARDRTGGFIISHKRLVFVMEDIPFSSRSYNLIDYVTIATTGDARILEIY